ncbi:MAG: MFS transporter, partial [Haloferacaceae archaeon]
SFAAFLVVAGALGGVEGISAPMQKTVLTRYAPPEVRAGIVSLNAALQNLGKTAGPIVIGTVVATAGAPTAFLALGAGGVALAIGLLLAVVVVGEREPPESG